MQIIFIGFFIRILLVVINFFYFPIPGGEFDTMKFYEEAILYKRYLSHEISVYDYQLGWMYSNFLGIIFLILGDSVILGSILSCIAWFFSAVIFRSILIDLKCKEGLIIIAVLAYAFIFPLSIIYTSFMLREVYILLLFNILILIVFRISKKKLFNNKFLNLILFVFISLIFISFHRSNAVFYLALIFFVTIYFFVKIYFQNLKNLNGLIILAGIAALMFHFEFFNGVFSVIYDYQIGHFDKQVPFRADYYTYEKFAALKYSFFGLIKLITNNIYNYSFQPSFLRASTYVDVVALYENLIRILFSFFAIFKLMKKFENKKFYILILFMFFLMEIIYAQATVNWGSASRHHVPVLGLLLLLVFFPIRKN